MFDYIELFYHIRALARRYPHSLIDEAQDIGMVHQAIIELLIGAGSQVSLISVRIKGSTNSLARTGSA